MQDDCITIALWLPGVQVVGQEETETEIAVEMRYRAQAMACPRCGCWTPKVHSTRLQRKRDMRLWGKAVFLTLHKRGFRCLVCRKEALRLWYRSSCRPEAEARLAIWENLVRGQGPEPFRSLLPMLQTWRQPILNYFSYRFTNGFLEGKNNRIKVIKRIAYGYRNSQNFRNRILLSNPKKVDPKAA